MVESGGNVGVDHCNLRIVTAVMKNLESDEHIVYSCDVSKQNKYHIWQKRQLLVTNKRIYNLCGHTFNRTIELTKVKALTKNLREGKEPEFLIHVENEWDYRLWCKTREELFSHLKAQCIGVMQ